MPTTPLLSAAEFSAGTGGKISASDPRLLPLLNGASAAIRRFCGWHITPVVDEDLVLDGPGGDVLSLPTLRLVDVTALEVSGEAVDVADLEWSASGEVRKCYWPTRYRSINISISHGFETAHDVKQIVQQVVANAISSSLGATREQAGAVSISWALTAPNVAGGISLLERDLAILSHYKLPSVA